ncbi:glutathione transferase GST 23 [Sorghum bicolor]|uniref:glutathione transferase GST 23 n=1 Tax=Sorghum bicolor TaxID=4558 RepID=UPI0003C6B3A0|nr:glutathione transferase GST 23 [Sorghum bicolor]|eukprot:XP_002448916.2 glutathione transferase GST 23 [Sorghum bicolor]
MDHHLEQQAAESEKKAAVKLLGFWASPYVLQVKWALAMKGVEYEYTEEDLRSKSAELLAYNPVHKKVPVLVYHGRPIAESQVILEFIDEAWNHRGDPILPRDPYQRAMARFRARFQQEKVSGLSVIFCYTRTFDQTLTMHESKILR